MLLKVAIGFLNARDWLNALKTWRFLSSQDRAAFVEIAAKIPDFIKWVNTQ